MALDPRTPVIVGVGQVTNRPDPDVAADRRPEPAVLMAAALRRAAEDAAGRGPDAADDSRAWAADGDGGCSVVAERLLRRASSLRIVSAMSWRVPDPAGPVADALGLGPGERRCSVVGGNMPVSLLHDAARAVAGGRLDVVLVTGAECLHTTALARRQGVRRSLPWTSQPDSTPPAAPFGEDRPPATELEMARGIRVPLHAYPLLENALRGAAGWSLDEHRARIGRLWSSFADVAADNPFAWIRRRYGAGELVEPGPGNRMVALPYTKLCTANLAVDQGAAYILSSVAAARALGLPEDRWVFPWAGAEANDHWFLSERPELSRSPAMRLAGGRALDLAGVGPSALGPVDLYSCFPAVVQMAAAELGLPVDDPARPLTLTGGLTFAGGPGNNYASHGLAAAVERLRHRPDAPALVSGLGWYSTKHAYAVLGARPPAAGYRWESVQAAVDALPRCPVDPAADGPVRIETYSVLFGRDGRADDAIVACRTAAGARTWATVPDADDLGELAGTEGIGRRAALRHGTLRLH